MRTEKCIVIIIKGRVLTNPCGTVSDVWKGGYRDILCTFKREGRKCDKWWFRSSIVWDREWGTDLKRYRFSTYLVFLQAWRWGQILYTVCSILILVCISGEGGVLTIYDKTLLLKEFSDVHNNTELSYLDML